MHASQVWKVAQNCTRTRCGMDKAKVSVLWSLLLKTSKHFATWRYVHFSNGLSSWQPLVWSNSDVRVNQRTTPSKNRHKNVQFSTQKRVTLYESKITRFFDASKRPKNSWKLAYDSFQQPSKNLPKTFQKSTQKRAVFDTKTCSFRHENVQFFAQNAI